ncbi:MAG: PLDc N-terminal domain-containing protein [Gammaproteobacteria bacterium]|nr:PLDc N-terminal domain-containing protein [Gammaproteobacteria bacterium]
MNPLTWSDQPWPLKCLSAALALWAVLHILLTKRDHPAASLGWVAIVLLLPLLGVVIYGWLGINRVQRRARLLRAPLQSVAASAWEPVDDPVSADIDLPMPLRPLEELGRHSSRRALTSNHHITAYHNGEQAYPAMLAAIAAARQQVWLSTYIFDTDAAGSDFIAALAAAQQRGVQVRVLIDGVGELYAWPRASRLLRRQQVPCARFLPLRLFPFTMYSNLRNHRKMLLIDAEQGFFGGMNIGDRHVLAAGKRTARDVQFCIQGGLLRQLTELFARDWRFVTGESLTPVTATSEHTAAAGHKSPTLARLIPDGPDQDLDRLRMTLLGAMRAAQRDIILMTPYFIPADEIASALKTAALSGVRVRLLLPDRSNIAIADWAGRALWPGLLEAGIQIHLLPPPFMHGKWLLIDDAYALLGSANIDERSLRLNYELGVEVYDQAFVSQLQQQSEQLLGTARRQSLEQLQQWSSWQQLRNAAAWLAAPYL